MNYNKEAKSLSFMRGSEVRQVLSFPQALEKGSRIWGFRLFKVWGFWALGLKALGILGFRVLGFGVEGLTV